MMTWEEHLEKLKEEEYRDMEDVAEYLGCSIENIGWGLTIDEKWRIFQLARKGWIVKKKQNEEEYSSVSTIKINKGKKKKDETRYEYGRIQISVPIEWVGYQVEVYVTKKYTPAIRHNFEGEVSFEEVVADRIDPSNLLSIALEKNNQEQKEVFLDGNNELIPPAKLFEKVKAGQIDPSRLLGLIRTDVLVQLITEQKGCLTMEAWEFLDKT